MRNTDAGLLTLGRNYRTAFCSTFSCVACVTQSTPRIASFSENTKQHTSGKGWKGHTATLLYRNRFCPTMSKLSRHRGKLKLISVPAHLALSFVTIPYSCLPLCACQLEYNRGARDQKRPASSFGLHGNNPPTTRARAHAHIHIHTAWKAAAEQTSVTLTFHLSSVQRSPRFCLPHISSSS